VGMWRTSPEIPDDTVAISGGGRGGSGGAMSGGTEGVSREPGGMPGGTKGILGGTRRVSGNTGGVSEGIWGVSGGCGGPVDCTEQHRASEEPVGTAAANSLHRGKRRRTGFLRNGNWTNAQL
jgi:hypothetical protein